ncbi:MAG TPA: DUF1918 domain-containing protein [Streptosporangiaceae bacterium]|jgi:hypothetical protein|nr:DUF1918 domain-containing protein [Streptosporangiaceae bacterium]
MKAAIGDGLTVKGRHQGDVDRHGEIIEVHGDQGSPPYVVHWQDGHESVFFPSADCLVDHHPRQAARRSARR